VRLTVDPWDPAYGTSSEDAGTESEAALDLEVERALAGWAPIAPSPGADHPDVVQFVDGVRRVDARLWIEGEGDAPPEPGLAASWAAGVVICDRQARLGPIEVGRGLFSAAAAATDLATRHGTYHRKPARTGIPEDLSLALQQAMAQSEVTVARLASAERFLVVDGPVRNRPGEAVGLIKTHHTHYLPPEQRSLLARLAPGERTPVFRIASSWIRHSWYLRLPGGGQGPMAGIVRCECSAEVATEVAVRLASWSGALLPRYASATHKDARAPQNLYPIGGLERELRRRLGDTRLLYRALLAAAA
jgi:hypothetical protein